MLFTTLPFAVFFVVVLGLVVASARMGRAETAPRRELAILLGASLLFYTCWRPAYLALLLLDIAVNWAFLRAMAHAAPGAAARRWLLAGSITFTLSLLVVFKYAAFALETLHPVLAAVSLEIPVPELLLPLGISFYSFQIVALAVDRFRDEGPAPRGFAEYALFVAFFPQLIAGPILRGRDLLPQIVSGGTRTPERTRRGVWLLASGVTKKVVLADFLLAPFVDEVFAAPGVANARFHWVALYGFAFQIYFDFSGYTDMARGLALLLGYELPLNFREPYLSRSPQEFWQRWHITLSRWLSLYCFVPLSRALLRRGPDAVGRYAIAVAQLVTMSLCGLWHGAAWSFVVWGALQGVLLVAWPTRRSRGDPDRLTVADWPQIVLFFHVFCLTIVFFRAPDLGAAGAYLGALFVPGELPGTPRLAAASVLAVAALHVAERFVRTRSGALQGWFGARPGRAYLEACAVGALAGLAILASGAGGEFIYFQF